MKSAISISMTSPNSPASPDGSETFPQAVATAAHRRDAKLVPPLSG